MLLFARGGVGKRQKGVLGAQKFSCALFGQRFCASIAVGQARQSRQILISPHSVCPQAKRLMGEERGE